MKFKYLLLLFILLSISCYSQEDYEFKLIKPLSVDELKGVWPEKGLVPDSITALKIAEAIWLPIYGKEVLEEKPYSCKIKNDSVWVVKGYLNPGSSGGSAYIEINKKDGRILKVLHFK